MMPILLDLDSRIENLLQSSGFHSLVLWSWEITADELWTLPNMAHFLPLNNIVYMEHLLYARHCSKDFCAFADSIQWPREADSVYIPLWMRRLRHSGVNESSMVSLLLGSEVVAEIHAIWLQSPRSNHQTTLPTREVCDISYVWAVCDV